LIREREAPRVRGCTYLSAIPNSVDDITYEVSLTEFTRLDGDGMPAV
jgi:hypothetical protein